MQKFIKYGSIQDMRILSIHILLYFEWIRRTCQNIYICFEEYKNLDRMNILISELIHLIEENDSNRILNFLEKNVEDYSRVLIN